MLAEAFNLSDSMAAFQTKEYAKDVLPVGTWGYRITNHGPGTIRFRIRMANVLQPKDSPVTTWKTLVKKDMIIQDETREGEFSVDKGPFGDAVEREVKFVFTRRLLTRRVSWTCEVFPVALID